MTTSDLKSLLERVQTWPEEAQDEFVAVANQIESELQGRDYLATREELRIIDAAMAAIDAGEVATDAEIAAAFAKFRSARSSSIRDGRLLISTRSRPIIQPARVPRLPHPSSVGWSMLLTAFAVHPNPLRASRNARASASLRSCAIHSGYFTGCVATQLIFYIFDTRRRAPRAMAINFRAGRAKAQPAGAGVGEAGLNSLRVMPGLVPCIHVLRR
jgi:hypothetical protein